MKKILLLLAGLSFLVACQDLNPVDAPPEFDLNHHFGVYVDTTFSATKATFKVDKYVNTDFASRLSVGRYGDFAGRSLLKFSDIPADFEFDSAYVELTSFGKFGTSGEALHISVLNPTNDWDDDVNSDPAWHTDIPGTQVAEFNTSVNDSEVIRIDLTKELVLSWIEDDAANHGLLLKTDETSNQFIREFESFQTLESTARPKLVLINKTDSTDIRDSTVTGIDAPIFNYLAEAGNDIFGLAGQNGQLLIASGIPARTFVQFEGLKSIPANAIIQGADLILQINDQDFFDPARSNPLDNPRHGNTFYLRSVKEAAEDLSSYTVDSSFAVSSSFSFIMDISDGQLRLASEGEQDKFGKNMIQNLVNDQIQSEWFYIQYVNEVKDISVKRIYGPAEKELKLNVRYYRVDNSGL